ncbi:MAG: imidazolonepropionase, partial [Muribaculaceae bacterium]|nr:imidazolonepropionase [Muribaculaceae bacterium]
MTRFRRITNCTIVTPTGTAAQHGAAMGHLTTITDAEIHIADERIAYAGSAEAAPQAPEEGVTMLPDIDARGCVVLPGFVDSHTHLVFGGLRADEFKMRLNGASYMEIMNAGGGIQSTVNATRGADHSDLYDKALYHLKQMSAMGITTVEAKSGYGLSLDTERKLLEIISELRSSSVPMTVVATMMAAHAVPAEYNGDTEAYVDHIIADMLPQLRSLADICDVFTERGVFEIEASRRLMSAAKALGYKLKFHADEITTLGGAELAVELGALSADHLLHVGDKGVKALAASDTVATLLPLTAFALKEPYAPARRLIDAGAAVALATDFNPGSCYSYSIPLLIALACIYMNMTIEEVITALTLNG